MFVAIEGGEGAGKTGLLATLAAMLQADGHDVLVTREPGGTPEGLALRALLLSRNGLAWEKEAELLLMTAARIQHVRCAILPALSAGRVVLCDRFIGSTLAYQGAGRGIAEEAIRDLHERFVGGVSPDVTVLLDIDPEIGLRRSRRRLDEEHADEGRFEALDLEFHRRVRQSFLDRADGNTIVVDARPPAAVVAEDVYSRLINRLSNAGEGLRLPRPSPA